MTNDVQLCLPECEELKLTPLQLEEKIEKLWKAMEITRDYQTYKYCWSEIDRLREFKYNKNK